MRRTTSRSRGDPGATASTSEGAAACRALPWSSELPLIMEGYPTELQDLLLRTRDPVARASPRSAQYRHQRRRKPLKDHAAVLRWAARDLMFNLEAIPEDKRDWRPAPEAKSALQMAGEVAGVIRNTLPVVEGGDWEPKDLPHPTTLEEARSQV